jgi:hypothetical protein
MESRRVVQDLKKEKDKIEEEVKELQKKKDTLTSHQFKYFQKQITEKYEEFYNNSMIKLLPFDDKVLFTRNDIARYKLQQKFITNYLN